MEFLWFWLAKLTQLDLFTMDRLCGHDLRLLWFKKFISSLRNSLNAKPGLMSYTSFVFFLFIPN